MLPVQRGHPALRATQFDPHHRHAQLIESYRQHVKSIDFDQTIWFQYIQHQKAKKSANGDTRVLTVQKLLDRQRKMDEILEQPKQARIQRDNSQAATAEWNLVKEVFPRDIRVFKQSV